MHSVAEMTIQVLFPGRTQDDHRCRPCLHSWDQKQGHREITMCLRWRRKAEGRCGEFILDPEKK